MADFDPIPEDRVITITLIIRRNLYGQIDRELGRTLGLDGHPALTLRQINSPQFPENTSMIEYAYLNTTGISGAKLIERILAKNPTFSARIFFQKPSDLICPGHMLSYHIKGTAEHPDNGMVIADLTAQEKGKLIVLLAIRYPSKLFGYGEFSEHNPDGSWDSKYYSTDASTLVRTLLTTDPPIEAKYKNAALYYVKNAFSRKHKTQAKLYKNFLESFIEVLTTVGAAVDIAPANINQTETPNQVNYKEKVNAAAVKAAAKAARDAAYAAKIAAYKANIGENIAKILKEKILDEELLEYLNTPEGIPKLKENLCREVGIEEPITILEYAILNKREPIINGLLSMPNLLERMDKNSNIILHARELHWMNIKVRSFNQYIESPLFTIDGIPMETLYQILYDAVSLTIINLVLKIFEEKGVNPVNLEPGAEDPPLDPTKLDIYYVYYTPQIPVEYSTFMTLYMHARKVFSNNPHHAMGATRDDADAIKGIIAGLHGNITGKELRAIAKKRAEVIHLPTDYIIPPPGPLRDGDPAIEARAFTAAHAHPVLWKGYSKSDELLLKDIFKPDIVVPGQTTQRPSIDAGFCPVCFAFIPHGDACIYMSHKCNPPDIINKTLYNKYKNQSDKIYWCTICNRPCNSHGHYKVSNMFGPVPDNAPNYTGIEIYGHDCRSLGGGGLLEKMGRFDALRKEAKALLPLIGTISHKEARLRLGKAFWNAPITDYRASATALLTAAGWENDPFPVVDEATPVTYGNIPYTGGTLLEGQLTNEVMAAEHLHVGDVLLPEIKREATETFNTLIEENPVIRYRHRKPDGVINLHVGEYSSVHGIFDSLKTHSTALSEATGNFGKCPICPATLHPDEIKYILEELLFDVDEWDAYNRIYIEYKKNYNRVIGLKIAQTADAATLDGGGNNNETDEDESGPVGNVLFPEMTNGECAIVSKKKGGKRPRTIKRIKLRRRVTHSRPIYNVKKGTRKSKSKSHRQSGTRSKSRR